MYEEETGWIVRCPFCGSEEECPHLVAVFDLSFGSLNGGELYGQWSGLKDAVSRAAVRRVRKGSLLDAEERDSSVTALLESVVSQLEERDLGQDDIMDDDVSDLYLDTYVLTEAVLTFLEHAGADRIPGSLVEGELPGLSSAMAVVFARKPKVVIRRCEKMLLEDIESGGGGG